jgi:hypothetical protein
MSTFCQRKYKFTDKKHSRGGIIASGLFLFSLVSLIQGVYISFANEGQGAMIVGVLGLASFLMSLVGFMVGIRSFKEDNVFVLFPWIGTFGCTAILIIMGGIILIGI